MIATDKPSVIDKVRLRKALEYQDEQTLSDILREIASGHSALLRAAHSTLTIQDIGPCLHIAQMAGCLRDVPEIHCELQIIARQMGKEYISLRGRKGWARVLKPWGYLPHGEHLRVEVLL